MNSHSDRYDELPRRKQRGIKDHNGQNPSPQGAGYSPGRNKKILHALIYKILKMLQECK